MRNALLGVPKMDEGERNQKLVPEGTALQIERLNIPFPAFLQGLEFETWLNRGFKDARLWVGESVVWRAD